MKRPLNIRITRIRRRYPNSTMFLPWFQFLNDLHNIITDTGFIGAEINCGIAQILGAKYFTKNL